MENMIKDEEIKEVSLNELKENAIMEAIALKKLQIVKVLYKKGLFKKEELKELNFEDYKNLPLKKDFKGYELYTDKDDNLYLIKELITDGNKYGYEVLTFIKCSLYEVELINETSSPRKGLFIAAFVIFLVSYLIGLLSFLYQMFNTLGKAPFMEALTSNYMFLGGSLIMGSGLLVILALAYFKRDK